MARGKILQSDKKVKQRNLQSVIDYAATLFQKKVVLEDCIATTGTKNMGICFTCGCLTPRGPNLHAGHWKKRSNHSVLFERVNCQIQDRMCNITLHGNMAVFRLRLVEKYGEAEVNRIEILAKQVKIWTFAELDEMVKKWRAQIKIMETHK